MPKNSAEVMQVLRKEVQKTQGEEGEKNAEVSVFLIRRRSEGGEPGGVEGDAIAEGSPGYGDHSFFEGLNKGRFGFSVFWGS